MSSEMIGIALTMLAITRALQDIFKHDDWRGHSLLRSPNYLPELDGKNLKASSNSKKYRRKHVATLMVTNDVIGRMKGEPFSKKKHRSCKGPSNMSLNVRDDGVSSPFHWLWGAGGFRTRPRLPPELKGGARRAAYLTQGGDQRLSRSIG